MGSGQGPHPGRTPEAPDIQVEAIYPPDRHPGGGGTDPPTIPARSEHPAPPFPPRRTVIYRHSRARLHGCRRWSDAGCQSRNGNPVPVIQAQAGVQPHHDSPKPASGSIMVIAKAGLRTVEHRLSFDAITLNQNIFMKYRYIKIPCIRKGTVYNHSILYG